MADSMGMSGGQPDRIGNTTGQIEFDQGRRQDGAGATGQSESLIDKAKTSAQNRVRSTAATTKQQAVDAVSTISSTLLTAGQQLSSKQSPVAGLVEQAAVRLDRVAKYLENTEPDDLMRRTETWARQNPALFVGGAFLLGVLGARFLKSSPPRSQGVDGAGSGASFADREVVRSPVADV